MYSLEYSPPSAVLHRGAINSTAPPLLPGEGRQMKQLASSYRSWQGMLLAAWEGHCRRQSMNGCPLGGALPRPAECITWRRFVEEANLQSSVLLRPSPPLPRTVLRTRKNLTKGFTFPSPPPSMATRAHEPHLSVTLWRQLGCRASVGSQLLRVEQGARQKPY